MIVTIEVSPWQRIGVANTATESTGGSGMLMVVVAVQLFASVTVKEYVPAARVNAPVPVYGGVPPVAATVIVVVPPLQGIGGAADVAMSAGG